VSPLQTLTLYNAVANKGKMMRPWLVNSILESGITTKENGPVTVVDKICSDETLRQLKECLEGVCKDEGGTAAKVFKNSFYKVAGKTGTALVANGKHGYAEHIYQSSFAGYFPADNPQYSCIVVIKNHPFAKKFVGAKVAAPVFKELADKLMSASPDLSAPNPATPGYATPNPATHAPSPKKDSAQFYYAGATGDMKAVAQAFAIDYRDSSGKNEWGRLYASNDRPVMSKQSVSRQLMPDVKGMGLKDALYLLENMNIKVMPNGKGKVKMQSVTPGTALQRNETVIIQLN